MSRSMEALGSGRLQTSQTLGGSGSRSGLAAGSKGSIQDLTGVGDGKAGRIGRSPLANVTQLTAAVSNSNLGKQGAKSKANIEEKDLSKENLAAGATDVAEPSAVEVVATASRQNLAPRQDRKVTNAFCVTLFCIEDRFAEMSSSLLKVCLRPDVLRSLTSPFKAAFQAYPNRDYCLLTLSTEAVEPPLLRMFTGVAHKLDWSPP